MDNARFQTMTNLFFHKLYQPGPLDEPHIQMAHSISMMYHPDLYVNITRTNVIAS